MFITFEGPEGSGKTTVIKMIESALLKLEVPFIITREPGGTAISEDIRNIILDKRNTELDPKAEALLYAASRRQHLVQKIRPAMKEGKHVLCDRYIDSSLAYQGVARGLGIDEVININMFATDNEFPDLTIYFDIPPEVGLERIKKNSNREVNRLDLEKLAFHEMVRQGFHEIGRKYPKRIVMIDATRSIPVVFDEVMKIILKKIKD